MRRRDIPNLITLLRLVSVIPLVLLLLHGHYRLALLVMLLAGLSDALDGFLAKRFGWTSRLGSILDPLADKLLLVVSYLCLGWLGLLPLWLVTVVLLRDVIIIGGALAYHLRFGRYDMAPSLVSKLNTFLQILLVLTVMYSLAIAALPFELLGLLVDAVLLSTVASGLDYVLRWGYKALRGHKERVR